MKKQLLFLLISIYSFNSIAQISFEKGYFIDNTDQKTYCLIKNIDWKNNPTEFEYKLSENEEPKISSIESTKEFRILNQSKYERSVVEIDRSSEDISKMGTDKNPIFKKEQLFLKVLLEGKADLFLYEDGNLKRFFYNIDNSEVKQLIFKEYLTPKNSIGKNVEYKKQLWNDLKCQNITVNDVETIDYKKNDFVNFFIKYNKCNNSDFIDFEKKQKKDLFNLTLRPGLNSSSLTIQNSISNSRDADFDNEFGFRFGIETEFILPFNKNKWAVLIEPTYQYYKSEKKLTSENVNADYTSIEIPIGIRHYMFLNNNSKLFINGSLIIDLSSNSKIDFESSSDLEFKTDNNLAFGLGYKYDKKYSLELRYQTGREILGNYISWSSDYNTLSVIFGYSIF